MKESPYLASHISREQKRCNRAIQWLENLKQMFSPEQLDTVKKAAERGDDKENTKLSRHIADALLKAIEKKKAGLKFLIRQPINSGIMQLIYLVILQMGMK